MQRAAYVEFSYAEWQNKSYLTYYWQANIKNFMRG
jgi:hypothetical protein